MTQTWAEIAMDYGVDCQDIIAIWVIDVAFEGDIVKVRQIFWELAFDLSLLQDILPFVPVPGLVNFPKVFYNQRIFFDTLRPLAKNSKAFWMDTEVWVNTKFNDCLLNDLAQVFI